MSAPVGERAAVLPRSEWTALAADHERAVHGRTAAHLERRRQGVKHPIEDFLFDYYGFRPGQLRRWEPGPDVGLQDAAEYAERRFYTVRDGVTWLDVDAFAAARRPAIDWAGRVLRATHAAEPSFACFGLHEWAMVYRQSPEQVRHQVIPLRVSADEVAAVVESHQIRCTHYDAFRFFTPDAVPRNLVQPVQGHQDAFEQPGCLHGGAMDLYRWSFKLAPAVPSALLLETFDLARRARLLDMASAPYDTRSLGLTNLAIETPEGKAAHVAEQRAIAEVAAPLRKRLIDVIDRLGAAG